MFGSVVIEVALGLILVYLLFGLICTAVNELLAQAFRLRAKTLAEGIRNILADPDAQGLAKLFYQHPLIKAFYREGDRPSYIPARAFAATVLDLVTKDHSAQFDKLEDGVSRLGNEKMRNVLQIFVERSGGKIEKVQESLEQWFNDSVERVSGWYKRRIQIITLIVAGLATGFSNADTVTIANQLARNSVLRAALVAQAEMVARQSATLTVAQVQEEVKALQGEGLEIGWSKDNTVGVLPWATKIFGLLLTTLAASLGAPFWFDMLNKVVQLRSSVAARAQTEPSKN